MGQRIELEGCPPMGNRFLLPASGSSHSLMFLAPTCSYMTALPPLSVLILLLKTANPLKFPPITKKSSFLTRLNFCCCQIFMSKHVFFKQG